MSYATQTFIDCLSGIVSGVSCFKGFLLHVQIQEQRFCD